jgi:hypothetical protein
MTENHPITPSPEQVDQWFDDAIRLNSTPKYYIATQAAQWGSDQELDECCESGLAKYRKPILGDVSSLCSPHQAAELEGAGVGSTA